MWWFLILFINYYSTILMAWCYLIFSLDCVFPAGYEVFSEGLNPEVNSPLETRVCAGRVKITTIEIWE